MAETAERFPNLLTIPEAAKAARVSVPTMYRRVQAGDVPGVIRVSNDGHGPLRIIEPRFRAWLLGEE
jgi:hypothetical protein